MTNEFTRPANPPKRNLFTLTYRALVLFLLLSISMILTFGLFHKASLTPQCQAAINKANIVITSQNSLVQGLQSSYEKDVYNNPKVTTIVQQTFLANEYQFTALQMIAMQNAALLDITTTCH
jgi:hypothetical protein